MDTIAKEVTPRMSGTNLIKAKDHNSAVVLDLIRTQGPLSRADIARSTSLSRQTVQNIVAKLDELGMVDMRSGIAVGRGHPGVRVSMKRNAAHFFGVQVDRTWVNFVLTDVFGQIDWSLNLPLHEQNIESIHRTIVQGISIGKQTTKSLALNILGCGIAAAGPFDVDNNQYSPTSFSELGTPDSLAYLKEVLALPIALSNDANAAAMGEELHGNHGGQTDFATLHFGAGLGSALIIDGTIYQGAYGNIGEIGHIQVDPTGSKCHCGRNGCLEQYLSYDALCRELTLSSDEPKSYDIIRTLIDSRSAELMRWVAPAALRLRQSLQILDALLSPAEIIITGTAPDELLQLLMEAARPYPIRIGSNKEIIVLRGNTSEWSIAVGAAALALNTQFAPSMSRLML
ncbi:ROK family transcriptional regulator [Marinomonas sp. RSW2]|uniref:ROK family transcriptional regulator n=1 Tax=Marinomonas maritima TaxID=2940935 RepID=A0ABT5WHZ1_9GAMM|nr:ROK family transcriptional regulator [Marinomonas maritima]MDE8604437.1 ROK family transcriptional regulator [Marinomonas maritima]